MGDIFLVIYIVILLFTIIVVNRNKKDKCRMNKVSPIFFIASLIGVAVYGFKIAFDFNFVYLIKLFYWLFVMGLSIYLLKKCG